jgi:hypothetical protein
MIKNAYVLMMFRRSFSIIKFQNTCSAQYLGAILKKYKVSNPNWHCSFRHGGQRCICLAVLDWFFGQQLLNLFVGDLQELERRLDNAVEKEGEVHKQSKTEDLKPLESLPA